ncbi:MAG: potassium-transporting ATPase subunit KdpA [Planctomycetes bacterium]|nr:potassium-transporting ATPase subunit KdpA [Planctomycetota bacterium]
MNASLIQNIIYVVVLVALAFPLGTWMANVYAGRPGRIFGFLKPIERGLYRLAGVDPAKDMTWKGWSWAVLIFSFLSTVVVYALQRLQAHLPFNPAGLPAVSPDSSFNTAISFVTNTNWQGYSGEATMSYFTQMAALAVQNFLSAAVGMAVMVALARGLSKTAKGLGNFWVDMTRSTLYILLPLSFVFALILVSQGVVQTFRAPVTAELTQKTKAADGTVIDTQTISVGPVASQIAIKQLGTNGGGYYNANSAHPIENPTPLSNFLQCLAILAIGAGCCITFGTIVGDGRQGKMLLAAMTLMFVLALVGATLAERAPSRLLHDAGATASNMEGKETRIGVDGSTLWAVATTSASNGSVNSMHDSYTPIGGLFPMLLMMLGEVVFGGVGSGLYGMILFVVFTVFISGLLVGRTPEYLGKKIGPFEMKMAAIGILIPCASVLVAAAIAVVAPKGYAGICNQGAHGFSEMLYATTSASNNNGSAFAGLSANTPFWNYLLGLCMVICRFGVIIPVLAIAGSMSARKVTPEGPGTLPTHTPLFIVLLIAVVLLVGALNFVPALFLGPVLEHVSAFRS